MRPRYARREMGKRRNVVVMPEKTAGGWDEKQHEG
jgi:hypothetical protein